ncbi:SAP30-binding protein-like [Diachasmimorpha longicaudata]|uniref:SAP30-binding protein-like n=1 Tax=Diachasmimorpha longicaudata TaxID=58733 RepID=UPI0030B8AF2B
MDELRRETIVDVSRLLLGVKLKNRQQSCTVPATILREMEEWGGRKQWDASRMRVLATPFGGIPSIIKYYQSSPFVSNALSVIHLPEYLLVDARRQNVGILLHVIKPSSLMGTENLAIRPVRHFSYDFVVYVLIKVYVTLGAESKEGVPNFGQHKSNQIKNQKLVCIALASLAVAYSDSEGEDDVDVDDEANTAPSQAAAPHNKQVGQPQGIVSPIFAKSATNSPTFPQTNNLNVNVTPIKLHQLVSYGVDDSVVRQEEVSVIPDEIADKPSASLQEDIYLDDLIPPEPPGECPADLQEKITTLHRKMETGGLDLSRIIEQRKDFKNPSIYSKLISFCRINELGTNYPPEYFDPFKWEQESYYEELGKVQDAAMEKLAKKVKSKAEVTPVTVKRPISVAITAVEESRRKVGKWDQVTTATASTKTTVVSSTAANDKKCKVIVAFGSVQKRRL